MADLLIPEIEEAVVDRLRERALIHGRTVETEAKTILQEAVQPPSQTWAKAHAIFKSLAASGRTFGDSTDLLREDRER